MALVAMTNREESGMHVGRRSALAAIACAFAVLFAAPAHALYPDKPVKLIVPFPAGGGGDTLARTMMAKVAEVLGQSIIIDNRAGAGGNIGIAAAARAEPDGYTLAYGTNGTHAINQALYKSTGFDPINDFVPVSRLSEIALLLVVNAEALPVKSVAELVAYLKAHPGKVNVATAGPGTSSHLASEMFKTSTGTEFLTVHYRGGGPAMTDMISGQMHMMIEVMPNAFPQVEGGKLRGLAVSTAVRWPQAPDIPTLTESGVPLTVSAWDAIFAPKGTPKDIVATLNAAINKALADPQLQQSLLARGARATPSTADELAQHVARELPRWGQVVQASGAKSE
jgi:tripartite-type tricarboxylate transporter receptor subunit TctC